MPAGALAVHDCKLGSRLADLRLAAGRADTGRGEHEAREQGTYCKPRCKVHIG
jgi:hypothetical protein